MEAWERIDAPQPALYWLEGRELDGGSRRVSDAKGAPFQASLRREVPMPVLVAQLDQMLHPEILRQVRLVSADFVVNIRPGDADTWQIFVECLLDFRGVGSTRPVDPGIGSAGTEPAVKSVGQVVEG